MQGKSLSPCRRWQEHLLHVLFGPLLQIFLAEFLLLSQVPGEQALQLSRRKVGAATEKTAVDVWMGG